MTLSLMEILLLSTAYGCGDLGIGKTNLAFNSMEDLKDPSSDVRTVMPMIDGLVFKEYLHKDGNHIFTITKKGEKILKSSSKELQDLAWQLPR